VWDRQDRSHTSLTNAVGDVTFRLILTDHVFKLDNVIFACKPRPDEFFLKNLRMRSTSLPPAVKQLFVLDAKKNIAGVTVTYICSIKKENGVYVAFN